MNAGEHLGTAASRARDEVRMSIGAGDWTRAGGGLWAACREAARVGDGAFLEAVSNPSFGRSLDDALPAFAGPPPSARAAALAAVAKLWCASVSNSTVSRTLVTQITTGFRFPGSPLCVPEPWFLDPCFPDRCAADLPVPGLLRELPVALDLFDDIAGRRGDGARSSVRVPLANVAGAGAARFSVRLCPGAAGLFPDVSAAPFTRWDDEFGGALERAWWAARLPAAAVRWSMTWEADGRPVDLVEGPSIGLGAAFALRALLQPGTWPTASKWSFTGGIDETGSAVSLLSTDHKLVVGYREKLEAMAGQTLALPAGDHASVAAFLERSCARVTLVPVEHLDDLRSTGPPTAESLEPARCPYQGLRAFGEDDASLYFGRERLVADVVRRLRDHGLVGVLGPSGAGKSSLARAGVLPALDRNAISGSQEWVHATCTPGTAPWANLLRAVQPHVGPAPGEDGTAFVTLLEARPPGSPTLVVVIDQFEELFTLAPSEDAAPFLAGLAAAAAMRGVKLIPVVRADYYGNAAVEPAFAEALSASHVLVGPMTEAELRRAVVAPAFDVGLTLEPLMVRSILDDVSDQPTALPHVSTALAETWARRSGNVLTLDGYVAAGGVANAVAQLAERLYDGSDAPTRAVIRRLAVQLVELGEDRTFRRRVPMTDIAPDGGSRRVLDQMASSRLVAIGDGDVELAHDALLTAWPRLGEWLLEDRERLLARRRLGQAAREWAAEGRPPDGLLRGARLDAIVAQLGPDGLPQPVGPDSADLSSEYLGASREAAKAGLEAELRTTRRLRRRLAFISVALIAALLGVLVAVNQRGNAVAERERAETAARSARAGELAGVAREQYADGQRSRGLLLALAALDRAPKVDALTALADGLRERERALFTTAASFSNTYGGALDVSADGSTLATADENHQVRLWDANTLTPSAALAGHRGPIARIRFNAQGTALASTDIDTDLPSMRIWASSGAKLGGHDLTVAATAVAWNAEGTQLVTGHGDGSIRFWSFPDVEPIASVGGGGVEVGDLVWTEDTVVAGLADGRVQLWDGPTGALVGELDPAGFDGPPLESVDALSATRDGRLLAVAGELNRSDPDPGALLGVVRVYDMASRLPLISDANEPAELLTKDLVKAVGWNPSGTRLSAGGGVAPNRDGGDASIVQWEPQRDVSLQSYQGHAVPVAAVAYRSDDRLLSIGEDLEISLWDTGGSWIELRGHEKTPCGPGSTPDIAWDQRFCAVWGVAYSPHGGRVATAGMDRTVRIWDSDTGAEVLRIDDAHIPGWGTPDWSNDWMRRITYSHDATMVASSSDDGAVRIWDASTGVVTHVLAGATGYTFGLSFSPDDTKLVTGGMDNIVRVWDLATAKATVVGTHGPGRNRPESAIASVTWNPATPAVVASAGFDQTVRVWDVATGQVLAGPFVVESQIIALSYSPDGKWLAASSADGSVTVWAHDHTARTLRGSPAVLMDLAWSPDSRFLGTGTLDGNLVLWNIANGLPVSTTFQQNLIFDISFAPDGKHIAAATYEGIVYLTPVLAGTVDAACQVAGRNLTKAEWDAYIGPRQPYRLLCASFPPGQGVTVSAEPPSGLATNMAALLSSGLSPG